MITRNDVIEKYREYQVLFQKLLSDKKGELENMLKVTFENVVKEELCSGSDLFLGYYNPSPSIDLVVGNIHRGKIVKRLTDKTEVTHQYGFDENDRLILVKIVPPAFCENNDEYIVLEYDGNYVNLICFRNDEKCRGIYQLGQFEYDDKNRLIKSTVCDVVSAVDKCTVINHESYIYNDDGLYMMTMWDCDIVDEDDYDVIDGVCCGFIDGMSGNDTDKEIIDDFFREVKESGYICGIDVYRFYHDEDGYITSYEAVNDNGENEVFKLAKNKKRKV
ncbi:MAG: hypothetical protein IKB73_00510 [Ruminococcus sp.]|nr:hypothetical protein [Ruminococcus sp.]